MEREGRSDEGVPCGADVQATVQVHGGSTLADMDGSPV